MTTGRGGWWRMVEVGGGLLLASTIFHRPSPTSSHLQQARDVLLATTTSTRDAGLLDSLLPVFERRTGYTVKVIAVGSGQALAMGRRGDADVVLSHAPEAERALVDSGYFVSRRLVMHNDFLFVGPPGDPAGLRGMTDPVAALQRIAQREASFVSRGDQSGTHQMEQKLWRVAGIRPPGAGGWYTDRKSTRLNSSHGYISYAVFCLKKKKNIDRLRKC